MSYEPTNWKAGDTVTSAKLNKLEQGVANSGIVDMNITKNNNTVTCKLNKTWQEIWDNNYTTVRVETYGYGKSFYLIEGIDTIAYGVYIFNPSDGNRMQLQASGADDYPTYEYTQL